MKNLFSLLTLIPALLLAATPSQPSQPSQPLNSSQPSQPSQPVSVKSVRNPFWPIGYEGKREVITPEVRIVPKKPEQILQERESASAKVRAAAAAAAEKARAEAAERERIVTSEHWAAAYRALRFGSRVKALAEEGGREASSIVVNGKVYANGDLISFTHGKNRFTWRVAQLVDGRTVRLDRVAARHLGKTPGKINSEKTDADDSAKGDSK